MEFLGKSEELKLSHPFDHPKNKKPSDNLRYRGFKVPRTGLEPVHPYGHRILSPMNFGLSWANIP